MVIVENPDIAVFLAALLLNDLATLSVPRVKTVEARPRPVLHSTDGQPEDEMQYEVEALRQVTEPSAFRRRLPTPVQSASASEENPGS